MKQNTFWALIFCLIAFQMVHPYAYGALYGNKVFFDGRVDYVNQRNDPTKTGTPNFQALRMKGARLNWMGKLKNKHPFRVRYNLISNTSYRVGDNSQTALEYFYLKLLLSDQFSLRLGKALRMGGGIEYNYNSMDLYYEGVTPALFPQYETGAVLSYYFGDQEVGFELNNSDMPVDDNGKNKQQNLSYNIYWNGSFLNDYLMPTASFIYAPTANSDRVDKYLAIGLIKNVEDYGLLWEVEYVEAQNYDEENLMTRNSSVINKMTYVGESFRPFLKLAYDIKKEGSTKQFERVGGVLALEYYPSKEDDDVRYHVSYSLEHKGGKVASIPNSTQHKVYVGFRAYFPVFKRKIFL